MLDKVFNYFQQHHFLKSFSMIAGSTLSAQIINVLFSLVVTRLYAPDVYGIMSIFLSTIGILDIASMLTYEKAIPIIDGEENTWAMMRCCIRLLVVSVCLLILCCVFFSKSTFALLGIASLYEHRFLIPVGVFLSGVFAVFLQWAYRSRDYEIISKVKIYQSMAGGLVRILGGFISSQATWLLLGTIANEFAGISALIRKAKKKGLFGCYCKDGVSVLKQQYRFPAYMLPSDLINAVATSGPVLILGYFFGVEVSGYFGLVNSVVSVPLNLICSSMATVIYAEAAYLTSDNAIQIRNICWKATKVVGLGSIPGFAILYFWGPELFSFVFGSKWYAAGEYARVMIGYFWGYCMIIPSSRIMEVFNKQYVALSLNILRTFLLVIVVFWIKSYEVTSQMAVFTICSVNMFVYFIGLICCFYILNSYVRVQQKSM